MSKPYGAADAKKAQSEGWLIVQAPVRLDTVLELPFRLQAGETQALALALELPDSLLLVDDAQGRRAAKALGLAFTGTLGVLLRAKAEGQIAELRPVLQLLKTRTTFWLNPVVYDAVLRQAGEGSD